VWSTSGRSVAGIDAGAFTAELLPFVETASHSALVVSHGGSGGLYPAITAGTPVLAIPSNADNQLSTAVLEENGVGLGVRVEEASETRLYAALSRILSEPSFTASAKRWAQVFQQDENLNRFCKFVRIRL
jgi:UDP:flavonoid glycosyltransferase YjiC (YdhE family)